VAEVLCGATLSPAALLDAIPQRDPFRFVDEILDVDDEHIVAAHRFLPDAPFYRGHFPGRPITPGVLLIETMAQAAVVAHGIWLLAKQFGLDGMDKRITLFTDASVEFRSVVEPGERVVVTGRKQFFRRSVLRSQVELRGEDGRLACVGLLSGMGAMR
jgi:3-hydroxyacyl-[acyl-carrier-protein] dehydratase